MLRYVYKKMCSDWRMVTLESFHMINGGKTNNCERIIVDFQFLGN